MDCKKGFFMELQNFSVNDGEGIRTTIFFAGCPLRCDWCANPEGFSTDYKVAYYKDICIKCGLCVECCPNDVGINLNDKIERYKCISCGKCVDVCKTGSRKNLIYKYDVNEILNVIERQKIFYRKSGGGVTFSGGEATFQSDILRQLTNELYDQAISLTIETSGYFNFEENKDIFQKMDLIFVDIKHMDEIKHKEYTGVSNKIILENICKMNQLKVPMVIRIPVILNINSTEENVRNTARFLSSNVDNPKIELLPYHCFGDEKYEALGLKKPSRDFVPPSKETMEKLVRIIEDEGVEIVSYK